MNFDKSKAILKKINVLHDSASSFDGSISKMERDLLLHYLRELYEVVSTDVEVTRPKEVRKTVAHTETYAPPAVQYQEPVKSQSAPIQQTHYQQEPVAVQQTPHHLQPSYIPQPPVHQEPPTPPVEKKSPTIDKGLLELFSSKDSSDLGSRFSRLPISDISKSMGINDKILTINELFKGDQSEFNQVVSKLNKFDSFDEAKDYLIDGVAKDNDWSSPSKIEKAKVFIKLIKRRYL